MGDDVVMDRLDEEEVEDPPASDVVLEEREFDDDARIDDEEGLAAEEEEVDPAEEEDELAGDVEVVLDWTVDEEVTETDEEELGGAAELELLGGGGGGAESLVKLVDTGGSELVEEAVVVEEVVDVEVDAALLDGGTVLEVGAMEELASGGELGAVEDAAIADLGISNGNRTRGATYVDDGTVEGADEVRELDVDAGIDEELAEDGDGSTVDVTEELVIAALTLAMSGWRERKEGRGVEGYDMT